MIPLKDNLVQLVASNWDTPMAVVVDDELDVDDARSLTDWIDFKEALQGDAIFFSQFESYLDEQGHNIEEPPHVSLWKQLTGSLSFPDNEEIRNALQQYEEREQVVSSLVSFLQDIGFSTKSFQSKPEKEDIGAANLFLADYQLIPESGDGESAMQLFCELMTSCSETGSTPPLVILMSNKQLLFAKGF